MALVDWGVPYYYVNMWPFQLKLKPSLLIEAILSHNVTTGLGCFFGGLIQYRSTPKMSTRLYLGYFSLVPVEGLHWSPLRGGGGVPLYMYSQIPSSYISTDWHSHVRLTLKKTQHLCCFTCLVTVSPFFSISMTYFHVHPCIFISLYYIICCWNFTTLHDTGS